ncbi:uncharacterized protein B0H18DRAFT_1033825 [Fomitopsis serialis]|uniref:uncharacterized protein n=1 Tax=Fomitopsis serialis TaxID=139415 RepID=UPI002008149D|nr:uncharacterized protein B0H18DRAFT_1033825 [Neoantrodia serialis]KAH9917588.1 hypothetical protein B0H18DRAFT_1033825 [Neoantrodia serialis]
MFAFKLSALAGFAVLAATAVPNLVNPRATTTVDPSCPIVSTEVVTQTLSVIAPTTTGPFETTTFTVTSFSFPEETTTRTLVEGDGKTHTVTFGYIDTGPFPSDCHCAFLGRYQGQRGLTSFIVTYTNIQY